VITLVSVREPRRALFNCHRPKAVFDGKPLKFHSATPDGQREGRPYAYDPTIN